MRSKYLKRKFLKSSVFFILFIVFIILIIGINLAKNYLNFRKNEVNNLPIIDYVFLKAKKTPLDINKEIQKSASPVFKTPILLYHYVEYIRDNKDMIRKSLNITPNVFESQIRTLLDNGYAFITVSDLGEALDKKAVLPKNSVIMTFDDGYEDFYQDVLPILRKYNIRVTAYIAPGFIGKPNYMSEEELTEAAVSGLVEIGAHTMHHIYLKGIAYNIASQEIAQSRILLNEMTHLPIVSFAYPYGVFDNQAINLVKDAGFTTAVTTVPGKEESNENRYFIYRIRPGVRIGKELIDYLTGDYFKPY